MKFSRFCAVLLAMLLWTLQGFAQSPERTLSARISPHAAHDLVDGPTAGTLTVPILPSDYVTEQHGPLNISFPRNMRPVVAPLLAHATRDVQTLSRQLGLREIPPLHIRLVADVVAMRALAPVEAAPPLYAVGVAYPTVRLALVSATAPRTWEASNMAQVFRHELSHLLFAEASGHAALPRWLTEGLAVLQADENSFQRFQELATASWTHRLLPLRRLDEGFSENPLDVSAAYAEASDFVGYLLRIDGSTRFALLLEHCHEGMPFEQALEETYGASMARIEEEWRHNLESRVAFAPLWAGTSILSIAGMVFVVIAWARRWRRNRKVRAQWDREEQTLRARSWLVLGRPPLRLVRSPVSNASSGDGGREGVPQVSTDEGPHTLH
jgi:hypothetical protein